MNSLKKHINRSLELFYVSVNNDIDNWTRCVDKTIISERYDNVYFEFCKNELRLFIVKSFSKEYIIISKYKFWIIPTNFKVFRYKFKLDRHFIKVSKDNKRLNNQNKNNNKIIILKSGISKIESKYAKAIRKEKLKNLM